MSGKKRSTATVSACGRFVDLSIDTWSERFPVEKLASQIAFYEGLRDRKGGQYAQHYEGTVKALHAAQKIHTALHKPKEAQT